MSDERVTDADRRAALDELCERDDCVGELARDYRETGAASWIDDSAPRPSTDDAAGYCPNCGEGLGGDENYCPGCREPVDN